MHGYVWGIPLGTKNFQVRKHIQYYKHGALILRKRYKHYFSILTFITLFPLNFFPGWHITSFILHVRISKRV